MKWLDHPVVAYLIIAAFSLIAGTLLFQVGGSVAEVTNQSGTLLGFSFEAGGALGGFLIILALSVKLLEKLQSRSPAAAVLKVQIKGRPRLAREITYRCWYEVIDGAGDRYRVDVDPHWEGSYLTVDVRGAGQEDLIGLFVEDESGSRWESDFFHARARVTDVRQIGSPAEAEEPA